VNRLLLNTLPPDGVDVMIQRVEEFVIGLFANRYEFGLLV
jgi:hypothetical protein